MLPRRENTKDLFFGLLEESCLFPSPDQRTGALGAQLWMALASQLACARESYSTQSLAPVRGAPALFEWGEWS